MSETTLEIWHSPEIVPVFLDPVAAKLGVPPKVERFILRIAGTDIESGPFGLTLASLIVDLVGCGAHPFVRLGCGRAYRHERGPHFQMAAALLADLHWQRARSGPVAEPTGGTVPAYLTLGGLSVQHPAAPAIAEKFFTAGFVGVKLQIRASDQGVLVDDDLRAIERISSVKPAGCLLMADMHRTMAPAEVDSSSRRLGEAGVDWIEEPVSNAAEVASSHSAVSFAFGEHCYDEYDQDAVIGNEKVHVWQPDISWSGGVERNVQNARRVRLAGKVIAPHAAGLRSAVMLARAHPELVDFLEFHWSLDPTRQGLQEPRGLLPRDGCVDLDTDLLLAKDALFARLECR